MLSAGKLKARTDKIRAAGPESWNESGIAGLKIGWETAEIATMQKLKILKWLGMLFLGAVLAVSVWAAVTMKRYAGTPGTGPDHQVIFAIAPGETFDALTTRLETEGVIANPVKFKILARIKGDDKKLKAGEFLLSSTMTPNQILDVMVNGKSYLYRLTIPEGFTARQIAAEIAAQGLGNADAFMELVNDAHTAADLGIEAQTLEGYLFPDTYYFPKGVSPMTIVQKMVNRFKEEFRPQWYERAREIKFTVHQIVTLASIIEKETGDAAERPVISSVFHNRLRRHMRLESDPTVIYGIKEFDGNIKRSHLSTPTPYNTYTIRGLPPGPIASPGRSSIEAALYPAQTKYLFFVSKKDHTHYFSETIAEHNKAVRKYQLRRRSKPKS